MVVRCPRCAGISRESSGKEEAHVSDLTSCRFRSALFVILKTYWQPRSWICPACAGGKKGLNSIQCGGGRLEHTYRLNLRVPISTVWTLKAHQHHFLKEGNPCKE